MHKETMRKWFICIASISIFAAIQAVGFQVFQQAKSGIVCLWPYLAFSALAAAVFIIYYAAFDRRQVPGSHSLA